MSAPVQKSDKEMWLAYASKLKDVVVSGGLGPNDRLYLAPLSSAGIAAGKDIAEAIKNFGVYNSADSLLDLNSPIFVPGVDSYFQRVQNYMYNIELKSDKDPGAVKRLNDAIATAADAQLAYEKVSDAAYDRWEKEKKRGQTNATFPDWIAANNYPPYGDAKDLVAATANDVTKASADVSGAQAPLVNRYIQALRSAADTTIHSTSYNMECSEASADQINARKAGNKDVQTPFFKPDYNINSQYAADVDAWIATYPQKKKNPKTFSFNVADAQNAKWSDFGYKETTVSVQGSYCIFFSATFTVGTETRTEHISASQAASDLQVTVTMADVNTYTIKPGSWEVSNLKQFPLRDDAPKTLLKPAAKVTQVTMAYGVGLQIKMSSSLSTQVHDLMQKAWQTGGSCSFFGYDIGLGGSASSKSSSTATFDQVNSASSGTTVNIPPDDNAYPTLLAAIGISLET